MAEWFEDGELWAEFAPFMFDERRWAEARAVASGACSLAGVVPGARVLDLCCGPGRVTTELADLGFRATGLDLDARLLEAAKETAKERSLSIEYLRGDARSAADVPAGRFDACLNLYTSFGYSDDEEGDFELAKRAYGSLAPGGAFVLETGGLECVARDFVEDEWYEKDGALVLASYRALESWRYLENRWIAIREGRRFERRFRIRLYSASELRSLLARAGFVEVAAYGDFDASPYDHSARTLVMVAKKGK
jgi:SAM-dependent methyltransferase